MFPRSWPRAVRLILSGIVVLVMMGTGLLVTVTALMTNPGYIDPTTDEPSTLGVIMTGLGMLALLTLPFYRRAPLVPMIAGAVVALLLRLDPFVLAVGLTVWIVRAERRWHWAVAAAGFAIIMICAGLHLHALSGWPDPDYRRTGQILVAVVTVLCLGLVLGISLGVRQRRSARAAEAHARAAEHSNEQLTEELTRQQERQVLAREVHDTLASDLSGLSLHVGGLEKAAQHAGDPRLDDELRTTRHYADRALTNLRTLLTSLREGGAGDDAPAPSPQGVADLQALFAEAAAGGVEARPFVLVDGFSAAPDALQHAVRRILQEALTNVLRHSSDRTAEVSLTGGEGQGIDLRVTNRVPEQPRFTAGSGTGLVGLEERARALGGTVETRQHEGRFILTVRLPWPLPETAEHPA
ncbi:sensor histidine kinase [Nesterenkonia xinjiangensis]|uniref:histidine kinase n=1 Tax=Nesterenkonia xinjiangensis TaxID=225327 RepID=A0A7Z0K8D8_9MICC|nr:histidine kinase [Nesterenkonia xinjiangensis]NYJ77509.1 signal transduction histidine kinase [Nesterenkonia xinjiangensis]